MHGSRRLEEVEEVQKSRFLREEKEVGEVAEHRSRHGSEYSGGVRRRKHSEKLLG